MLKIILQNNVVLEHRFEELISVSVIPINVVESNDCF